MFLFALKIFESVVNHFYLPDQEKYAFPLFSNSSSLQFKSDQCQHKGFLKTHSSDIVDSNRKMVHFRQKIANITKFMLFGFITYVTNEVDMI